MLIFTKIIFYLIFLIEIIFIYPKYHQIFQNYSTHGKDAFILFTLETDALLVSSMIIIIAGLLYMFSVISIEDGYGLYIIGWLPQDIISLIIICKSETRARYISTGHKAIMESDIPLSTITDIFCSNKKITSIEIIYKIICIIFEIIASVLWITSCFVSIHIIFINIMVNWFFH